MEEKSEIKKNVEIGWIFPASIFAFVVVSWLATGYFLVGDKTGRGTFGDMFGTINALFSGLAFAGVIYAILLQRKELKYQREELKLTRMELKGQKQQLEAQNTTLKKQNFENTFFQLLRLHNELTTSIEHRSTGHVTGRKCFDLFYKQLIDIYKNLNKNKLIEADQRNKAYLDFYERNHNQVSHYFRNLYAIVKFIENSEVGDVELYVNLIRVQLTDIELLLLFYHSLTDVDGKKLKPLIENYGLFKSLLKDKLLNRRAHEPLYDKGAYIPIWSTTPNVSHQ